METKEFIKGIIEELDKYHDMQMQMFITQITEMLKNLHNEQKQILSNLKDYAGSKCPNQQGTEGKMD